MLKAKKKDELVWRGVNYKLNCPRECVFEKTNLGFHLNLTVTLDEFFSNTLPWTVEFILTQHIGVYTISIQQVLLSLEAVIK